jgi:hypothetical protein
MTVDIPTDVRGPASGPWLPGVQLSPADRDAPSGWYKRALGVETLNRRLNVIHLPSDRLSSTERTDIERLTVSQDLPRMAAVWSVIVKAGQHVVVHVGIVYRDIQVGDTRVAIGGLRHIVWADGLGDQEYGGAVLASAASFVGQWLWAPFLVVICAPAEARPLQALGWRVSTEPLTAETAAAAERLVGRNAVSLPCQGEAA